MKCGQEQKGLCGFTQSIMVDCSLSLVTVRKRISEYTRFTNFSNLLSPNTHTLTHSHNTHTLT